MDGARKGDDGLFESNFGEKAFFDNRADKLASGIEIANYESRHRICRVVVISVALELRKNQRSCNHAKIGL